VRFGPVFRLDQPPRAGKAGADDWAAGQVMGRLAALLPAELWGEYRPFWSGQRG
jgi:hypothetical protein